jgi:hypothetical protein
MIESSMLALKKHARPRFRLDGSFLFASRRHVSWSPVIALVPERTYSPRARRVTSPAPPPRHRLGSASAPLPRVTGWKATGRLYKSPSCRFPLHTTPLASPAPDLSPASPPPRSVESLFIAAAPLALLTMCSMK